MRKQYRFLLKRLKETKVVIASADIFYALRLINTEYPDWEIEAFWPVNLW